jgi:hypothetical protein
LALSIVKELKYPPYHFAHPFIAAKSASTTIMDHKYPIQASSFLAEGTIGLDDIRMSLESTPDQESHCFDMASNLNYEVRQFSDEKLVPLR